MPSDLEHWHIDATVHKDRVEETHYISDPAKNIRRRLETTTWHVEKYLGRGACGEVRLERNREEGKARAVKKITIPDVDLSNIECEKELKALLEFSKPKSRDAAVFVEFYGWFKDGLDLFLAMEYFQLGDLERNVLACGGKIPGTEARDIAEQILSGIKLMHASSFAHRDLKPQNVLVVHASPKWWVKLADFGLSKRLTDTTAYHTRSGTPSYMAPEVLGFLDASDSSSEYTNAVDIWAAGCIIYRLIAGHVPFPQIKALVKYCENEFLFPYDDPFGSNAQKEGSSFIRQLLVSDPNNRPSASQAVKHTWIISGSNTPMPSTESSSPSQNILSEFSDLTVSQVNFNTVTHDGLKSYQSFPSGNTPSPQSSLQQTTPRPITGSPVENNATIILKPIPPQAFEASSSQTQNKYIPQQPPPAPVDGKSIITLKLLIDYPCATSRGDILTFKRGDFVRFAKKINEDWWMGTIGGQRGYIPSTYVQLMPSDFGSTQFDPEVQLDPATSAPARVKALYDYSSREPLDLEFRKGDIICVLEVKNKDWWKGAVEGRESFGLFPTNHVESLPPTTDELRREKITHVTAVVDVDVKQSTVLVLRKGDIIELIGPNFEDWWAGFRILSHGLPKSGLFHLAWVRKLRNGTVPVHSYHNMPHQPAPSRAPAMLHRPTLPTSQYPTNRGDSNNVDRQAREKTPHMLI